MQYIYTYIENILLQAVHQVEIYSPKVLGALVILLLGVMASRGVYLAVMYIFKKFKIVELIDTLLSDIEDKFDHIETSDNTEIQEKKQKRKKLKPKRFSEKIKIDSITAKAFGYYVLLLSLRWAISYIGITDIEKFLQDLIDYLPSLFIGLLIGFFGIRFANFVYDIIYHALDLARENTAKIMAMTAKIVILFFTFMLMLDYIKVVDKFILNTIIIGFISMISLAGGLAFGLGGKDIARNILESFKK